VGAAFLLVISALSGLDRHHKLPFYKICVNVAPFLHLRLVTQANVVLLSEELVARDYATEPKLTGDV
jgi:hypothetical protein